jgi:hypothetical protein
LDRLHTYVSRTKGELYEPIHSSLDDLLSESYSVLVYQEDVMRVAKGMARFSCKQANKSRKALGKKNHAARVPDYKAAFMDGCRFIVTLKKSGFCVGGRPRVRVSGKDARTLPTRSPETHEQRATLPCGPFLAVHPAWLHRGLVGFCQAL